MLNNIAALLDSGVVAAASSYESIATSSVGAGGVTYVEFTSIPSTYTHLQIRMRSKTTNSGDINFRFNSDTGNNYTSHGLFGDGSSASVITPYIGTSSGYVGYSPSINSGAVIDVLDYSSTSKYKTVRTLFGNDNNGSGYIMLNSSVWMSTSAISTIRILVGAGTLEQYSHFALYGIK